jgi:hypothetical protein
MELDRYQVYPFSGGHHGRDWEAIKREVLAKSRQ